MMADWNDGSVKGIEDFCSEIWADSDSVTEHCPNCGAMVTEKEE